ncbi:hypothetical protein BC939DRAFT_440500 [Gamsiella multidivaricata]|uniref:uncharacterized protein n=1 Tax=Gamsiella multidivaricata TaxID=101098 RepID=UPI00222091E8|nr:uncharacterized protein BC939DRAFT_440500 [Gamsiella multidivaricata]KAI7829762.1 hypothetical protein BC939DRAFT_440500 [Gamsiella multidivaricata]
MLSIFLSHPLLLSICLYHRRLPSSYSKTPTTRPNAKSARKTTTARLTTHVRKGISCHHVARSFHTATTTVGA